MAIEFKLPELGENIASADIVNVLVKEGDKIEKDQVVLEIETDKATIEVPSEMTGVVSKVLVKPGDKAEVGQAVFLIDSDSSEEKAPEKTEAPKAEETKPAAKIESEPEPVKEEKTETISEQTSLIEIKMPELGENIQSATITKVHIEAGDKIEKDQILIDVETDKATIEVPSEVSGTVKEVKIKDGENAEIGQVIMVVDGVGIVKKSEKAQPTVPAQTESTTVKSAPESAKPVHAQAPAVGKRHSEIGKKVAPAAPSVRRFAREIGVDIHNVRGTGPGGRISIEDIKLYAKNLNQKLTQAAESGMPIGIKTEALPDFSKWGEVEVQSMSNVRKKTAEHLSYAWSTIPHVTQFDKADITELEKLRKQYSKAVESQGGKLTVTAILLKIIAGAMKVYPQFNSSIDMEKKEIIFKKYVNIGIAADTPKGLLVPVIKNVEKKNITQLSIELTEISKKARDGKLSLDEMQGGNFSISNLGGIGGTYFTPIVNSPEVAILGVSRGAFEPVYKDGQFEPRLMLPLSLSYDHRIIDGADAARFVRWVAQALENPFLLSLEG